jgi:hypothetical protein
MPRNRTIHPHFPRVPAIGRLSRDARLLFILLWTVADDKGRLRLDAESLVEQLYPFDGDAVQLLPGWLDELERQRCIERYEVEGATFLRIVGWQRLQTIDRPSRSRLPASPSEPDPREAREPREESPEMPMRRASKANPLEDAFFEEQEALLSHAGEFTSERVLGFLDLALRKSLASGMHTAPARYIELAGRKAGLWSGRGTSSGRREPRDRESTGPGPAELRGLPDTSRGDD